MRPRWRLKTLMFAVLASATAVNVVAQASRLRFVRHGDVSMVENEIPMWISLALAYAVAVYVFSRWYRPFAAARRERARATRAAPRVDRRD